MQVREQVQERRTNHTLERLESLKLPFYRTDHALRPAAYTLTIREDYLAMNVYGSFDAMNKDMLFTYADKISTKEKCAIVLGSGSDLNVFDKSAPCVHVGSINGFDVWTQDVETWEGRTYNLFKENLLLVLDGGEFKDYEDASSYIEGLKPVSAQELTIYDNGF